MTGASGWFGATALDLLFAAPGEAADGRVVGYAGSGREITLPSGRAVEVRPLAELLTDEPPAVLLHFAYLTRDRAGEVALGDYVTSNVAISAIVQEAVRRHRPQLMVTASSGAVHEPDGTLAHDLATNPYGTLKVLDELAFARAAEQVGAGWAVPRVFAVAGAGITKPEKYALGSMIQAARDGGPVEIRATRPVYRTYCGVDEVIALALWAAAHRPSVFDTHGHLVEMADLAAAVARTVGNGCAVARAAFEPTQPADRYVGEPTVFRQLVADSGLRLATLDELVIATAGTAPGIGRSAARP